ncbi:hypothetical protein CICLE_v10013406mg [Citrus x clementina]|uniref:FCP1 domain-containing protein n=2 Tax=Citrus TaxID=2706 RepID=A0ACB8K386_CITSI|nr:hypothetical protein CICLE_v10013406mg [Citrus x clementina]KAH9738461.1 FCP1 domain-containing protein [Citrus sinensis]
MAEKSEDLKKKGISYDDSDDEGDSTCGLLLMKLNLVPRKKLIVLSIGGLLFYRRPCCKDFMDFCLERFEVGIWSSAREWYMNNALDCIMVGLRGKLIDQNECTNSGFNSLEKKNKPIFLKELKKIWENKALHSLCSIWAVWQMQMMLLYVKEHPFGQPAISPLHPDWNYYSKIIRRNSKTYYK